MYYRIKKDKREELQKGKTLTYIAEKCGYSRQYTTYVFNGKMLATEESAIKILKTLAEDSLDIAVEINQKGIKETLKHFFEEIE